MGLNIILAQLVGIIASGLNAIGTTSTNKKKILFLNGLCNFLGGVQYILLGAFTGCTSCILALTRNIIFNHYDNKKKQTPLWILLIYIFISIAINIPLIHHWYDVIPVFNICVYGYGIWQNNIKIEKIITMICGISGLIYNFIEKAYTSLISSVLDLFGGTIGYFKSLKESKNNKKSQS